MLYVCTLLSIILHFHVIQGTSQLCDSKPLTPPKPKPRSRVEKGTANFGAAYNITFHQLTLSILVMSLLS